MRADLPRSHKPIESQGCAADLATPVATIGHELLVELAEHGDLAFMDRDAQAVLMLDPAVMRARVERESNPFLKRALRARALLDQLRTARSTLAPGNRPSEAEIEDAGVSYAQAKADWTRFKRARHAETRLWQRTVDNIATACNRISVLRAAGHTCQPVPRAAFDLAIDMLEQAGRFRGAVQVSEWRIAYGDGPAAQDYVAIAQMCMRDGSPEEAIALMLQLIASPQRWVGTAPDAARLQFQGALAQAQIQAGLLDQALLSADRAAPPERARIRSVVFGKQRNREAMAQALQTMEAQCDSAAHIELFRAEVLLDLGFWQAALDNLGRFADGFAWNNPAFAKSVLALSMRPSVVLSQVRHDIDEHELWGNVAHAFGWDDPTDPILRHATHMVTMQLPEVDAQGPHPVLALRLPGD